MSANGRQVMAQRGFSMVELMVALVLGLLLTSAVLQTFLGAKKSFEFQEEFSRIQETGRFAIDVVSKDIRAADFWGCRTKLEKQGGKKIFNRLNNPDASIHTFEAVSGAEGSVNGTLHSPDRLVLTGASYNGIGTPANPTSTASNSSQFKVKKGHKFEEGQIILVGDCSAGDIIQVTSVNKTDSQNHDIVHHAKNTPGIVPGNASQGLSSLSHESQIFVAASNAYSIGTGASGEPALMKNGVELVEGVENLQLLYGVRRADGTVFVPADQVGAANWGDVISVHVSLLVRSLRDNLVTASQTIDFNGVSFAAPGGDRRLRKAFTSTVAIRNRLD